MPMKPTEMTAAKSDVAAEMLAAAIWEAVNSRPADSPTAASTNRLLRRHARELCQIHPTIVEADVLADHDSDTRVTSEYAAAIPGTNGQG